MKNNSTSKSAKNRVQNIEDLKKEIEIGWYGKTSKRSIQDIIDSKIDARRS